MDVYHNVVSMQVQLFQRDKLMSLLYMDGMKLYPIF